MSLKKYNSVSTIGSLIVLGAFLYFFFKEITKREESLYERQIEQCNHFYQQKYEGIEIKKSPGREWMYTLNSGKVFKVYPHCDNHNTLIKVSD